VCVVSQLLGFFCIVFAVPAVAVVPRLSRRSSGQCLVLGILIGIANDRIAIIGVGEGLAHLGVVEGRLGQVERERIGAAASIFFILRPKRRVALERRHVVWIGDDDVDLVVLVGLERYREILNVGVLDCIKLGPAFPIVLVGLELDQVGGFVDLAYLEGAVANLVGGIFVPLLAALVD